VVLGLPYGYACCCGGGGAHAYGTGYAAALAVAAVALVQDLEAVQLVAAAVVPAVVVAAEPADAVMPQGQVEEHVSH